MQAREDDERDQFDALSNDKQALADAFMTWLSDNGGSLHPSMFLAEHTAMGMGVFTRTPLEPDILAIKVPTKLCITLRCAKERIAQLLQLPVDELTSDKSGIDEEKWWIVLYLYLHKQIIRMLSKGQAPPVDGTTRAGKRRKRSPTRDTELDAVREHPAIEAFLQHKSYVKLLPDDVSIPMTFTPVERACLLGTPLFNHIITRRKLNLEAHFKALTWFHRQTRSYQNPSFDALKRFFDAEEFKPLTKSPSQSEIDDAKSLSDAFSYIHRNGFYSTHDSDPPSVVTWMWAEAVLVSRAFPPRVINEEGDTPPVLIPGYDLFNHKRESKVTWFFDCRTGPLDVVTLTLHNSLQAGEQATNTYGPRPNEQLLASYGFADPRMLDDTLTIQRNPNSPPYLLSHGEPIPEALLDETLRSCLEHQGFRDVVDSCVKPFYERMHKRHHRKILKGMQKRFAMNNILMALTMKRDNSEKAQGMIELLFARFDAQGYPDDQVARKSIVESVKIYRQGQKRLHAYAIETAKEAEEQIAMDVLDKIL